MKQGAARTNFSAGHIQYLESSSSPALALPSLCLWAYLRSWDPVSFSLDGQVSPHTFRPQNLSFNGHGLQGARISNAYR